MPSFALEIMEVRCNCLNWKVDCAEIFSFVGIFCEIIYKMPSVTGKYFLTGDYYLKAISLLPCGIAGNIHIPLPKPSINYNYQQLLYL